MRKTIFTAGEHYHVFNRGVDQRVVFEFDAHFQRFYENLYLFNDVSYKRSGISELQRTTLLASSAAFEHQRDRLVDILAFVLLPSHFHLHLIERKEGGISTFLHKLEMGYSRFFNGRDQRRGNLFNNSFESRHVDNEAYLLHIPRYIHLNPLDLTPLNWREGSISDKLWPLASEFLDTYMWSSHGIYIGKTQRLPVVSEALATEFFSSPSQYRQFLQDWSGRYFYSPDE